VTTYLVQVAGEEVEVVVEEADGALRVSVDCRTRRVDAVEVLSGWYSLVVDHASHELGTLPGTGAAGERGLETAGPRRRTLVLDGYTYEATVSRGGRRPAGSRGRGDAVHGHEVRAPMPGLLVAVHAAEGTPVEAGQPLVTMEAMKMQMEIRSPGPGTVRRVHAAPGGEVAGGQVLVTLD